MSQINICFFNMSRRLHRRIIPRRSLETDILMRFLETGPAIPEKLLIDRDEGRVVFFCGSGVSRAYADLPDFFGLAKQVVNSLRVASDSPVKKVLDIMHDVEERTGVGGLISADRIFGLLEQEFQEVDIESEIAKALRPGPDVNLLAHRLLLDLATCSDGRVQLITTNFDRLFEQCSKKIKSSLPPRLPDLTRNDELRGIVYLHGRANGDYTGAEEGGFVISSSDFGKAYLADGWSTQFVREVLQRYTIVFVGYSADDPPIHYLLEGLNKSAGEISNLYAFQAGTEEEATARWYHKGVQAIPYETACQHRALWDTLRLWAKRARNPENWYETTLSLAKKNPRDLQPFERGQVAHMITTMQGAGLFANSENPPPAEWLCVFDPRCRYAPPGRRLSFTVSGPWTDPFQLYGLDTDRVPANTQEHEVSPKRDLPPEAFDGFSINHTDWRSIEKEDIADIRRGQVSQLPSRLKRISQWIGNVSNQPACVWWAVRQQGLHPEVKSQIQYNLYGPSLSYDSIIRRVWLLLFDAWDGMRTDYTTETNVWEETLAKEGWNGLTTRQFAVSQRPYLSVRQDIMIGPVPPSDHVNYGLSDLASFEVEYPTSWGDWQVPDEWLALYVRELRKNIEHAVHLETVTSGTKLSYIGPIKKDPARHGDMQFDDDLPDIIMRYTKEFERLCASDITLATKEFAAWPSDYESVFDLLRIWASGNEEVVGKSEFRKVLSDLSDRVFWKSRFQRDLLLVLASRWMALSKTVRKYIERRILKGPDQWKRETDSDFLKRRAHAILDRLYWLAENGCELSFDLETKTRKLREEVPEWSPKDANSATQWMEMQGGYVSINLDHVALDNVPVGSILEKAHQIRRDKKHFLHENDPFAGLSNDDPIRALSALSHAVKHGEYPEEEWSTFLNCDAREKDQPKLAATIAERIVQFPNRDVAKIIDAASRWFRNAARLIAGPYPQSFNKVLRKFLKVFQEFPDSGKSSVVRKKNDVDWGLEAVNSPVQRVAFALFNDPLIKPFLKNSKRNVGFPQEWIAIVEELLRLDGDARRYAIVQFARSLNWFFYIDREWTEKNMIAILDRADLTDQSAMWSGFFSRTELVAPELFFIIKAKMLELPCKSIGRGKRFDKILAGVILEEWRVASTEDDERFVTDDEMHAVLLHSDDDFREDIVSYAKTWLNPESERDADKLATLVLKLLNQVWPRQLVVKSEKTTLSLLNLVFANANHFAEIADAVLPHMIKVNIRHLRMPSHMITTESRVVDDNPEKVLTLLYKVLSEDARKWPYQTSAVLDRIGVVDLSIKSDSRFIELMRRWNSR